MVTCRSESYPYETEAPGPMTFASDPGSPGSAMMAGMPPIVA